MRVMAKVAPASSGSSWQFFSRFTFTPLLDPEKSVTRQLLTDILKMLPLGMHKTNAGEWQWFQLHKWF